MTDCDKLRDDVIAAKRERNNAQIANARAEDAGRPPLHSDADMAALRLAVDMASMEARSAGCDIDDLVGPHVGNLTDP